MMKMLPQTDNVLITILSKTVFLCSKRVLGVWASAFFIASVGFTSVHAESGSSIPAPSGPTESFVELDEGLMIERLPFDIEPKVNKIFTLSEPEWEQIKKPPHILNSLVALSGLNTFQSDKLLTSSNAGLPKPPFFKFVRSADSGSSKSWRFSIINSQGNVIHEQKGMGTPPSVLEWDGQESGWMKIKTAEPYNMVLTTVDQNQKEVKDIGTPLSHAILTANLKNSALIMIKGDMIFENDSNVGLTVTGKELLSTCAQKMAENSGRPIVLEVYARSVLRAESQVKSLTEFLANLLMIDVRSFETHLQVDPLDPEEVRIQILGGRL